MKRNRLSQILLFNISLIVCTVAIIILANFFDIIQSTTVIADETGSKIIVSLGDSYSSGEGVEEFYGQDKKLSKKVKDPDWLAHRSQYSWPGQLELEDVGIMSDCRGKNWFFAASSGAETKDIKGSQEKKYKKYRTPYIPYSSLNYKTIRQLSAYKGKVDLKPQLDIFDQLGNRKADYVTLTLGGNDAGFGKIVTDVVLGSTYMNLSLLPYHLEKVWKQFYAKDGIRDQLIETYQAIEEKAGKQATIIVVGYPKLFEKDGKGVFPSKIEAELVNDSVAKFNRAIESLVHECRMDGMNICFVSVEQAFEGNEAYTDNPYINEVMLYKTSEDIHDFDPLVGEIASAYSMHPNSYGVSQYAACVQEKIDEIEKQKKLGTYKLNDADEKPSERDVVLVLDTSGSMDGDSIEETKNAAAKFVDTVLDEEARVGIVEYNDGAGLICPFTTDKDALNNAIDSLVANGDTDMEGGLALADKMLSYSSAKKKTIVLMSDGEPNVGLEGQDLIDYADELKAKGYYVYTLGFFEGGDYITDAQYLMEHIASDGCHYEVSDSDSLVFFFGDIADQINGTKYMYVRIACPVDVSVTSDGETLDSSEDDLTVRTSFGSLTFEDTDTQNMDDYEENEYDEESDDKEDNRVKILRLKEGKDYDVKIRGTGRGIMNYSIGFMDDNGEYSDFRKFKDIDIRDDTRIDTVASVSPKTILKVDEDGDGEYDVKYEAKSNEEGVVVEEPDYSLLIIFITVFVLSFVLLIVLIIILHHRNKQ